MSENKNVPSFGPKTGDAAEAGGALSNALAEKLKGAKIIAPPKGEESTVGAKEAKRPPMAKKEVEKAVIEERRPSASDLFFGYKGKANIAKYEKQIAELMKVGVPSMEEVGKFFPNGSKLYDVVEANYPSWSMKSKQAILAGNKKVGKPEKHREIEKLDFNKALEHIARKKEAILKTIKEGGRNRFEREIVFPESDQERFYKLSQDEQNKLWVARDAANREIDGAIGEQNRLNKNHTPIRPISQPISAKTETPEEKEMRIQREQADMEMTRNAAMFTLAKISNVEELWAKNEKEGNEKFNKKTRELWKEFAVHGRFAVDEKGNPTPIVDTDLDGEVSLGLFRLAKFDVSNIKPVNPGDFEEGRLMLDSGGRDGVSFEMNSDDVATLFFDHHGEKSGKDTSAAAITYKTLIGLGLLEKDPVLDKVVEFVSQVDNWTFPQQELFFDRSNITVLGLYRWIKFDKLVEFAKGKKKFTDLLSQQELRDLGLEDRSRKQGWTVENAKKKFDELEKNGQVFHSSKYGRVVVSMDKELRGRYDAARYFGCDTFLEWNPKTQGFAIYSDKVIGDDFGEGVKVREKMWMRPPREGQPLKTSLGEIIKKMAGDDFQPIGDLAKYLEEERAQKEQQAEAEWLPEEGVLLESYRKTIGEIVAIFKEEVDWKGYTPELKARALRDQAEVLIRREMEKRDQFSGKEDKAIENIMTGASF